MATDHEPAIAALFALLENVAPFLTTGRRVIHWARVPEQPALFLRQMTEDYPHRPALGMPSKVTLDLEAWLYTKTILEDADGPGAALNALVLSVRTALEPLPYEKQTLGGLVMDCWIEGKIEFDSGDLDDQAKATVPIKILVPC